MIEIDCPECRGSGKTPLGSVYSRALDALRSQPGEISGTGLAKVLQVNATTANNQLLHLEAKGLVASRRDGRSRLWRAL
jgi:DNA-binding IclR family transcriptional regulator